MSKIIGQPGDLASVSSPSISDVLNAAAERIENFGWWSSRMEDCVGGKRCAGLAICDGPPNAPIHGACDYFANHLRLSNPHLLATIYDWNDAPGRTQAEVVAALRSAANASQTEEQDQ